MEPGQPRHGWQNVATEPVVTTSLSVCGRGCLSPRRLSSDRRAVLWQAFHSPVSPRLRRLGLTPSVFRVLLLRRLWQPLPPSSRFCRCGLLLDPLGHHRAACGGAGVLGRRAFALESAAARVCREAGARVTTNVMVRDLDLVPQERVDGRRLEVVADGLPLFHGAQLAVDTTMVAPHTPTWQR